MSKHEIVVPENNLPAWVYLHNQNIGGYVEPHWHSSIELSYTISGRIEQFTIAGTSYTSEPGTILVVNSMDVHSIKAFPNPLGEQSAISIIFPYSLIKSYFPRIDQYRINVNELSNDEKKNRKEYCLLQKKLLNLADIYQGDMQIRKSILLLEILEILLNNFLVKRDVKIAEPKDRRKKEQLNDIKNYIDNNYRYCISLEDIAKENYVSKEHLSRFFKENMGMTVFQYLNFVRAKNARILLKEGSLTATQVAVKCGFSGLRTMDRALLTNYGLSSRTLKKK